MPSLQIISSRLQQLVESPTFSRRSKKSLKSSKTPTNCVPFLPHLAFVKPIDNECNMSPLLSVRRSHTPSMLSAVTTTGVYSPTSVLSSLSFAKSESCLPDPTLPSSSHANIPESKDKSNCDQLSKAIPIVTVHEAGSEITAVEKEAAVSLVQKPHISEPPNLSERGGGGCNSIASTVCDSLENSPHSGLNFQKNEHEIYLDNLRVLQFGNMGSTAIGDDFLSEGPLSHQNDGDWEEIDVREWQNDPTWPKVNAD